MRVFVAGGTGVLGRRLVPLLVERGHEVTATTTSAAKLDVAARLGAEGVVMDGLDAASVGEAVAKARPDVIVHQMTAISVAHAGKADMKHMDRWFAGTNRLRTEGTDHLLAAADATGVTRFVAQAYASWNGIREGGWVKTEEDPLDPMAGTPAEPGMAALAHVEDAVTRAGGTVLRYGWFYGPGATGDLVEPVRKRQFLIVGAAPPLLVHPPGRRGARDRPRRGEAGERGVQHRRRRARPGERVAAPSRRVRGREEADAGPRLAGPPLAGDVAVTMMTEGRGFSNAKARAELGWEPRYASWRQGFQEELA